MRPVAASAVRPSSRAIRARWKSSVGSSASSSTSPAPSSPHRLGPPSGTIAVAASGEGAALPAVAAPPSTGSGESGSGPGWRSSNRTPIEPLAEAASTGQIADRCMPANTGSSDPSARSIARPASRRASPGRPSAACASAAITSPRMSSGWRSSHAPAASPAPARSPVRQRASARSRIASSSRSVRPASVSSSARASPSDPRSRWTRARTRSGSRAPPELPESPPERAAPGAVPWVTSPATPVPVVVGVMRAA